MTILEICVEDVAGVKTAQEIGIPRVEICADLSVGGVTPSVELVQECAEFAPAIGIVLMIRPRGGDFLYTDEEIQIMCEQAREFSILATDLEFPLQMITGAITPEARIDLQAMTRIKDAANGLPMICHRAFDVTKNLRQSLEDLADLGYVRVLTTGGDPAVASVENIKSLVEAESPVTILGSGGLRPHNVTQVVTQTGIQEVHMRTPYADGRAGTDPQMAQAALEALSRGVI